ncbi:MAG: GTP 3',8-cyclase MoaA, partial [Neglectibacter timonensis]
VMFHGFCGKVGFISAVSRPFCLQCNRIRITANGLLKPCLQYRSGKDLKALMDSGADDDSLRTAIEETVKLKPKGHHFGKEAGAEDEGLYMNQIGG